MILQNCIFHEDNEYEELYYRASKTVSQEERGIFLPAGQELSTDTYMNCFDMEAWRKYTGCSEVSLCMSMEGKGTLSLICEQKDGAKKVLELSVDTGQEEIKLPEDFVTGLVYFKVHADTDMWIHRAHYRTAQKKERECRIALVICTYKRKNYLEHILEVLKQGSGFKEEAKWLDVTVIDNASELENDYGDYIRVFHNRNTGGSGGFSRGMDEVVENLRNFPATHVVLMDDDVELLFESFIRLRALLAYEKEEYIAEPVAGRMFRKDKPVVQYTAAEIWNGGDLRHLGWNLDMTIRHNLWKMNDNTGAEYGGWWFECYPIEFVKNNRPLPFFIHCDDVEYGLRHGGTPIILNGIQVWHETADYRQTPVIMYYDCRNSMIVNHRKNNDLQLTKTYESWRHRLDQVYAEGKEINIYMVVKAFNDFLKGSKYLYHIDSEKMHKRLLKIQTGKLKNAIAWRVVVLKYKLLVIIGGKDDDWVNW